MPPSCLEVPVHTEFHIVEFTASAKMRFARIYCIMIYSVLRN